MSTEEVLFYTYLPSGGGSPPCPTSITPLVVGRSSTGPLKREDPRPWPMRKSVTAETPKKQLLRPASCIANQLILHKQLTSK